MKSTEPKMRIMLFSDEPLLVLGAAHALASSVEFEIIQAPANVVELLPSARRERPDMLLIDLCSDVTFGLLPLLQESLNGCRIVLWARSVGDEFTQQAKELGIAGLIPRTATSEQFIAQLIGVAEGRSAFDEQTSTCVTRVHLTRRESQIVALLAQGLQNKEIATCLGITEGTVKSYLVTLFHKVGARDRFELTVLGLKNSYCGHASWDGQGSFVTEKEESRVSHRSNPWSW